MNPFDQAQSLPPPIFVSVEEAKRLLSLGHSRIYQLMRSGEIDYVKQGAKTLIRYDSITRFADSLSKVAA